MSFLHVIESFFITQAILWSNYGILDMQQTDRGWSDPGHTGNMQGMVQLVEIGLYEVCRLTSGYPSITQGPYELAIALRSLSGSDPGD